VYRGSIYAQKSIIPFSLIYSMKASSQQISNRTLFIHDNLPVLLGMNSETVDLMYLDPPFNSNRMHYAAAGSRAAGGVFNDSWTLSRVASEWIAGIENEHPSLAAVLRLAGSIGTERQASATQAYLQFMAIRLLEMHRILKPTGSIYLHCDTTMSHYLKIVMDYIFGKAHFLNEIVWFYTNAGGRSKRRFSKKHDIILLYSKTSTYFFDTDGARIPYEQGSSTHSLLERGGHIPFKKGSKVYKYVPNKKGKVAEDVWRIQILNQMSKERTGYPTQKPLALLERIIKASSKEGDVVLDPFCGCATTLIASERLSRQWIGIDVSEKAVDLATARMEQECDTRKELIVRTDVPVRTS